MYPPPSPFESPTEKMQIARAKMLQRHPFFARLAYKLKLVEDPSQGTAGTDGISLFFNPAHVWEQSVPELIMLYAHEVLHPALHHNLRRNGRDFNLWNEACDYVVNAILQESGFEIPPNWLYEPAFEGMPAEEIYKILKNRKAQQQGPDPQSEQQEGQDGGDDDSSDDNANDSGNTDDNESGSQGPGDSNPDNESEHNQGENDGQGQEGGDGQGDGQDEQENPDGQGSGTGQDDTAPDQERQTSSPDRPGDVMDYPGDPDKNGPTEDDAARHEQEWKTAVANAEQIAKSRGVMPGNLQELVDALLEPKVDWRDVLRHFLERIAANDYSWEQPDRRYLQQGFYLPSLYSHELGDIVIAVDTSCSRTKAELQQDATEISDILALYDSTVHLIYVDTRVCGYETYRREDLPLKLEFKGRGGTMFSPAFKWVDENADGLDIAAMLYLTDMECNDFPAAPPDYPVLWIQNGGRGDPPPFGELVKM